MHSYTLSERATLMRLLSAAAFLVLFQAYLVVPLIPVLALDFHAAASVLGLMVPAYTIPYGLSTLFYGPLSDKYGRKHVFFVLLGLMAIATLLTAYSQTAMWFLLIRVLMGIATGGIVPIAIALLGDIYPYEERGKPIGMLYGAMAGGMTFGSTLGAYLNPVIGWRMEFMITAALTVVVFALAVFYHRLFHSTRSADRFSLSLIFKNCGKLLATVEGSRLYSYIFLNGMFHSGIFAWLGYYFSHRYQLGDQGIGLALLGYGIPGMLLGVGIGRLADSYGRKRIIQLGLLVSAVTVFILSMHTPLWVAGIAVAFLSLGYDMTQPLFAGMVTALNGGAERGQAVGLSACLLFLGYGAGALVFQYVLVYGINIALILFALLEILLALLALVYFKKLR